MKTQNKTTKRELTQKEINDQKKFAQQYFDLIQKELNHKDLCNTEQMKVWADCYKFHMNLVQYPFIEIPVFA